MNTAIGVVWMTAANVLIRLVGLLGQVLLGWYLLPSDFGIYAFALSIATAVSALRSGGIAQVAIQQGKTFDRHAPQYLRYAFAFNLLAMALLIGISVPYLLNKSPIGVVLAGIAISIPLGTHASIARIKLTIDGRFRVLSIVNCWSALIWQGTVVILAAQGFGATSFALPSLAQAIYESVAMWRAARMNSRRVETMKYRDIFQKCRWVMLSAVMLALATTGDYMAVSLVADAATVGTYFFAFQLVSAVCVPINSAMESVLPAHLVARGPQGDAQLHAYLAVVRGIAIVGIPLCICTALIAPVVVQLLWHGKWNAAIIAVQTLALCIPAWIVTTAGRAVLEAKALWRSRFVLMAIYGAGGMLSAAVGAMLGGVALIALFVTIFYIFFAMGQHIFVSRQVGRVERTMWIIVVPFAMNLLALLISVVATIPLRDKVSNLAYQAAITLVFFGISGAASMRLFSNDWQELLALIPRRNASLGAH